MIIMVAFFRCRFILYVLKQALFGRFPKSALTVGLSIPIDNDRFTRRNAIDVRPRVPRADVPVELDSLILLPYYLTAVVVVVVMVVAAEAAAAAAETHSLRRNHSVPVHSGAEVLIVV